MVEIDGLKIYGSPWTPYFYNWAFNAHRKIEEATKLNPVSYTHLRAHETVLDIV